MKMLTAKVRDGQLDVPKGLLEEGATVTVLIPESEEPFELTPEQRQVIEESIAQIERGEWVDGWALLDEIGSHLGARFEFRRTRSGRFAKRPIGGARTGRQLASLS